MNRKDWRWCKRCRRWVFWWSFGVGGLCPECWVDIATYDKRKAEAREAAAYLERDYAAIMV